VLRCALQDHAAGGGTASAVCASAQEPSLEGTDDGSKSSRRKLGAGLPAVLLRQLPALLRVAQPWHGLTLAGLSVVEAFLVARSEL